LLGCNLTEDALERSEVWGGDHVLAFHRAWGEYTNCSNSHSLYRPLPILSNRSYLHR
jgi:hypothetical protein